MAAHADFIYRLVDLVEYAEAHDLEVASLALNAAVEVIAPSFARTITISLADIEAANGPLPAPPRPRLTLIQGGAA